MKNTFRRILDCCVSGGLLLLVVGSAGCDEDAAEDVGYETAYAGDYAYPADVGYAGGFAGGGYYAAGVTPNVTVGRGAVGQAIRDAAMGVDVCAGQVTVTPHDGVMICGESRSGVDIVFTGCQLGGGGTLDGTVGVQLTRSASDANCNDGTTIMLGYTATISGLTYTGVAGGKIVIPSQMSTSTITYPFGQPPSSVTIMTNGEVQRMANDGSMTSDRTYLGSYTLSSISTSNKAYTLDGTLNVTDQSGGTATMTGTGLTRDAACCRPTGGSLAVSRTAAATRGLTTGRTPPPAGRRRSTTRRCPCPTVCDQRRRSPTSKRSGARSRCPPRDRYASTIRCFRTRRASGRRARSTIRLTA